MAILGLLPLSYRPLEEILQLTKQCHVFKADYIILLRFLESLFVIGLTDSALGYTTERPKGTLILEHRRLSRGKCKVRSAKAHLYYKRNQLRREKRKGFSFS
jgi:hypothetical protein